MDQRKECVCGKSYWRNQAWIHEKCGYGLSVVGGDAQADGVQEAEKGEGWGLDEGVVETIGDIERHPGAPQEGSKGRGVVEPKTGEVGKEDYSVVAAKAVKFDRVAYQRAYMRNVWRPRKAAEKAQKRRCDIKSE